MVMMKFSPWILPCIILSSLSWNGAAIASPQGEKVVLSAKENTLNDIASVPAPSRKPIRVSQPPVGAIRQPDADEQTRTRLRSLIRSAVTQGLIEERGADLPTKISASGYDIAPRKVVSCEGYNPIFLDIGPTDDVFDIIHGAHQTLLGEFDAVRTDALNHLIRVYLSVGMTDELRKLMDGFAEEIDTHAVYLNIAEKIDGPYMTNINDVVLSDQYLHCDPVLKAFLGFSEHEIETLDRARKGLWSYKNQPVSADLAPPSYIGDLRKLPFPIQAEIAQRAGIVAALNGDWPLAIHFLESKHLSNHNTDYGFFLEALIAWHEQRPEDTFTALQELGQSASNVSADAFSVFWNIFQDKNGDELSPDHPFVLNTEAMLELIEKRRGTRLTLFVVNDEIKRSKPTAQRLTEIYERFKALEVSPQDQHLIHQSVHQLIEEAFASQDLEKKAIVSEWLLEDENTLITPKIRTAFQDDVQSFLNDLDHGAEAENTAQEVVPVITDDREEVKKTTPKEPPFVDDQEIVSVNPTDIKSTLEETQSQIEKIERLLGDDSHSIVAGNQDDG